MNVPYELIGQAVVGLALILASFVALFVAGFLIISVADALETRYGRGLGILAFIGLPALFVLGYIAGRYGIFN